MTADRTPGISRGQVLAAVIAAMVSCGRETAVPTHPATPPACAPPLAPRVVVAPPAGFVPCPTVEELAEIDRIVPVVFADSGTLVCRSSDGSRDLTQVQKNVYQALLFMKQVEFDAPLPWTRASLFGWFTSNVRGVRVIAPPAFDSCCDPPGVISLVGNRATEWTLSPFLMAMVHEARHVDGGRHTCGEFLDNRIADLGAHGVTYYLLAWLGMHWPAASQPEREWALYRAESLRASAFCQECR